MFIHKALDFTETYVEAVNNALMGIDEEAELSKAQKEWLAFCLTGIIVNNEICWSKMEKSSLGDHTVAALSWMFRNAKITWPILLQASTNLLLNKYSITKGFLVVDDTEKRRAKVTKRLAFIHKIKDKKSGGYIMGQEVVFLLLVTEKITIPVGFAFYMPDPEYSQWYQNDKKLKKEGKEKKQRPEKPKKNPDYPTKQDLAVKMINEFKQNHPQVQINLALADNLYGTKDFMNKIGTVYDKIQTISQLKANQIIRFNNKEMTVEEFFRRRPCFSQTLRIRGGEEISVIVYSARIYVKSHRTKRFVIALKYPGEKEFRYLVASDLSWRTCDILEGQTFRWLVEVFIEDLKSYEGFGESAKQTDVEGSRNVLILSLLLDHSLLFHPDQKARIENKLPAFTVGSLINHSKVQSFLDFIRHLLSSDDLPQALELLSQSIRRYFKLAPSSKHMISRPLGKLESSPNLKSYAKACLARG